MNRRGKQLLIGLGFAVLLPLLQVAMTWGSLHQAHEPFHPLIDQHGILSLPAEKAKLQGERLRLSMDRQVVENWIHPRDQVSWEFLLPESGRYIIVVDYSAPIGRDGCLFATEIAGQTRLGNVHATGRVDRFLPQPLMTPVELQAGANRLLIRALEVPQGFVMDLRRVRMVPAAGG